LYISSKLCWKARTSIIVVSCYSFRSLNHREWDILIDPNWIEM